MVNQGKLSNELVTQKALALGFDLIGFAKSEELKEEVERLENWLRERYNGTMSYMERNLEKRLNVKEILPEAKSVISLALNYYTDEAYSNKAGSGKVSRYAFGTDYHYILWDKLEKLITELKEIDPNFSAKSYVDTGPVMDKAWAIHSGLGWMGKHSNIITKEFGSWIFLSTIITNYEFSNYGNVLGDFCGTCTRCIDACPTSAITESYIVNANKCISFLTIENKEEIPNELSGSFENWLFGCDICQDVCPWNKKFSKRTNEPGFFVKNSNKEINLYEIMEMDNIEFKMRFKDSPIMRAKLKGLKRNASFLRAGTDRTILNKTGKNK
ncbi:MAG: tRNA epoxyqueuosine(34) reductase QueG [Bacteroidota bacterium]|nr:tRNA epoxyqueuosine(34) reductase QueG [Bacteroidota bacterium]